MQFFVPPSFSNKSLLLLLLLLLLKTLTACDGQNSATNFNHTIIFLNIVNIVIIHCSAGQFNKVALLFFCQYISSFTETRFMLSDVTSIWIYQSPCPRGPVLSTLPCLPWPCLWPCPCPCPCPAPPLLLTYSAPTLPTQPLLCLLYLSAVCPKYID